MIEEFVVFLLFHSDSPGYNCLKYVSVFNGIIIIMSSITRNNELCDKENSYVAKAPRKDKLQTEELCVKKTVLGESSQPQSVIE